MKIALYIRQIDHEADPLVQRLAENLHRSGIETAMLSDGDSVDGYDYLFSIGGDGTLLSSVQFVRSCSTSAFPPVLGINFGHLGFLTTVGRESVDSLASDLLAGRFTIEERTLMEVEGEGIPSGSYALNEVFLHRGDEATLLRIQAYVDNDYVATYAGDGVIVATPTGSTAYSLSCGGPILTPNSRCFAITPISAHTLTLRPIIVPDSSCVRLKVCGNSCFTLGMDSRRTTVCGSADLLLRRAPFTVKLVRVSSQNFFSAIRDKLMWGTEVRQ